MWPDRVSNQGPLTYKSGALPTALGCPAIEDNSKIFFLISQQKHSHVGTPH